LLKHVVKHIATQDDLAAVETRLDRRIDKLDAKIDRLDIKLTKSRKTKSTSAFNLKSAFPRLKSTSASTKNRRLTAAPSPPQQPQL